LLEARVDALVLDQVDYGLGLVPMHLGIPYVHISNALHLDYSGNTPLCIFDWQHETTSEALARNQAGVREFMQVYEPVTSVAHAYAAEVGLDIDWTDPLATMSELAWLTQTPKEFDFESPHWPSRPFWVDAQPQKQQAPVFDWTRHWNSGRDRCFTTRAHSMTALAGSSRTFPGIA
jgi:hypothetical protein